MSPNEDDFAAMHQRYLARRSAATLPGGGLIYGWITIKKVGEREQEKPLDEGNSSDEEARR